MESHLHILEFHYYVLFVLKVISVTFYDNFPVKFKVSVNFFKNFQLCDNFSAYKN